MRKKIINAVLALIFLLGFAILLYPSVSDYVNSRHQTRAVAGYSESLMTYTKEDFSQLWEEAEAYNRQLPHTGGFHLFSDEEYARYDSLLRVSSTDVMGYIEIPRLDIYLPIYHGTSEGVLQVGVGHVEGSSLPTGGEDTHVVLSGHRGLPSSKLFTDLDKLEEGDEFYITVLDRVMAYEVDQIHITLPDDVRDLAVETGKDYVTLLTCTPYGINSHRLKVRGRRIDYVDELDYIVAADGIQIDPLNVAPLIAVPILLILVIAVFFGPKRKKRGLTIEELEEAYRRREHTKEAETPEIEK